MGRRDEQLKIRGYRVELGEIESRLNSLPGVGRAAVVADGADAGAVVLVAFTSGPAEPQEVRRNLAAYLPDYMVPRHVYRLDELPLTSNGKTDKRRLRHLAGALSAAGSETTAPRTPVELRLASKWAEVLDIPVEGIGRDDSFFELGATSLAAVRLVVSMDRAVSLRDLHARPVLHELAALVAERAVGGRADFPAYADRRALLLPLAEVSAAPVASLVCVPYAGGNAVNFTALARELSPHGVAVYGVDLPGHDLDSAPGSLRPSDEVTKTLIEEVSSHIREPWLLWGHCAGSALAVAVARGLEERGRPADHVFVGSLLLEDVATLEAERETVSMMTDDQVVWLLRRQGAYVELDASRGLRRSVVGPAYRHDVRSAAGEFIAAQTEPGARRLDTPLHVVVAADDPSTADSERRYSRWEALSRRVVLTVVPDGGHYFPAARPRHAAAVVLDTLDATSRSTAAGS